MKKVMTAAILLTALGILFNDSFKANAQMGSGMHGMMGNSGTAWGTGSFRTNGERIYFTATSDRGTEISYTNGPGSNNWMMMGGRMACVSCHGANGQGGKHSMGMMQVMESKDIRWSALKSEFDTESFRLAVVKGQDPDGTQLSTDMPRWNIGKEDLSDLIVFLKTLH